jgi:very-short-patch-repair endonuclease
MTDAERRLWRHLRHRQCAEARFRRQAPIGPYIADFACFERHLIVELGGGQHAERREEDEARTAWLNSQGYRVMRFWNCEVFEDLDALLEAIGGARKEAPPPRPGAGEGMARPWGVVN